ncbi:hypothetical protein BV911_01500 [Pseudoruegeria sp. SK021]|nr:hypothetical protein BV911_01500 [Pseudoruegeria sp. SK021]
MSPGLRLGISSVLVRPDARGNVLKRIDLGHYVLSRLTVGRNGQVGGLGPVVYGRAPAQMSP